jgi:ubiquitin carboxyl-terminal hydrolase L3
MLAFPQHSSRATMMECMAIPHPARLVLGRAWACERRGVRLTTPAMCSICLQVDRGLLAMIPRPVAAVILLFPCTEKIYAERAAEKRRLQMTGPSEACDSAFHLRQVASFGNACGTIAAVHALTNSVGCHSLNGPLAKFRQETADKTAAERGQALLTTRHLKQESDVAAEHASAQTACPSRDGPDLDHHYCAFVPITTSSGVRVVELDGTKSRPVDHGPQGQDFLETVCQVVQERFMNVEPDRIDFSLMALCANEQQNPPAH